MNYNDKKKESIDLDELDIKSHLNTSLDLNGISVSEDLINRTLEAIRRQPTQISSEEGGIKSPINEGKKLNYWNKYVRGFAGIAAAALILVAGYQVLDNLNFGGFMAKKEMESAPKNESVSYDKGAQDSIAEDSIAEDSIAEDGTLSAKGDAQDSSNSITSDNQDMDSAANNGSSANKEIGVATEDELEDSLFSITTEGLTNSNVNNYYTGAADESEPEQPNSQESTERLVLLTFRDIFLTDPEQAQYITLTDEVNKTSVTLTAKEEILEFYQVMDKHQFTQNTEAAKDQNYSVEISNPQKDALYTMIIGNSVTVNYQDEDVSSQNLYVAADIDLLKKDLMEFFIKYSK